jgi:transcriptional regulator GlxA family with amidase domain
LGRQECLVGATAGLIRAVVAGIINDMSLRPLRGWAQAVTVLQRRVVVVIYPGVQALDVTGPVEVFDTVNRFLPDPGAGYRIECVSTGAPLVRTSAGLAIGAAPLESGEGRIDTLLVPGGWSLDEALADRTLVEWIGRAARRSQRVASVCGGSFLLAEAGLLDGRRTTTHWAYCREMARRYPMVTVDPGPIFVWDGPFVTSAGVSTGIDMALALVEADHGADLALEIARYLVLFFKRHGGQPQFSAVLDARMADKAPIRAVQEWVGAHVEQPLPVPELAERAHMSPRNFARVFRREVGMTPGQYVTRIRITRARELLETTDLPIGQVAGRCGFTRIETFLRTFGRAMGLTPGLYRQRFQVLSPAGLMVDTAHIGNQS